VDNSALNYEILPCKNPEDYHTKYTATLVSLHSLTPHPRIGSE